MNRTTHGSALVASLLATMTAATAAVTAVVTGAELAVVTAAPAVVAEPTLPPATKVLEMQHLLLPRQGQVAVARRSRGGGLLPPPAATPSAPVLVCSGAPWAARPPRPHMAPCLGARVAALRPAQPIARCSLRWARPTFCARSTRAT